MKSYGLDMRGPFTVERLQTLPQWESSFEGRLVYQLSDNYLYVATSSQWARVIGEGEIQTDYLIRKYINNIDATTTGLYSIFKVSSDQMFILNTFDVIIENVSGVGVMPEVAFGTLTNPSLFVPSTQLSIDPILYKRQIWDKPFGSALQDTELVFSITDASTYPQISLIAVITGYLIPFTQVGPNEPEQAYRIIYTNEEYP